jgi:hypothetical protein
VIETGTAVMLFIALFAVILALCTSIILLCGSLEMLRRLDLRVQTWPRGFGNLAGSRETISHSTGEVIYPEDQLEQAAQAEAEAALRAEREDEDQRRQRSSRGPGPSDDEPPALG